MASNFARVQSALTSTHHEFAFLNPIDCPSDVVSALTSRLSHIDPKSWSARLSFGGTYLNGIEISTNRPLTAPCRIEYFEPKFDFQHAESFFPPFRSEYVLYRDGDLIVVFKPAHLPSIANREQKRHHLRRYVEKYLGTRVHMPSRLDTATQGVVAISCSARMHGRLQRLYERRLVHKDYLLEVPGKTSWKERAVCDPIGRSKQHAVLREVSSEGGQPAKTIFSKVLEQEFFPPTDTPTATTVLMAKPLSGRTHQIRVHAQELIEPIIGDNFYGGLPDHELHLLSYRVSLWHPFKEEQVTVTVPDELLPGWALRAASTKLP